MEDHVEGRAPDRELQAAAVADVGLDQFDLAPERRPDVLASPAGEVVDDRHLRSPLEQRVGQV